MQAIKIPENCKKMIILAEESGISESLAIIGSLSENNIDFTIYVKTDDQQKEISNQFQHISNNKINYIPSFKNEAVESIVDGQLIGTKIFIAGSSSMVQQVKEIAINAGFTEEEIQSKEFGPKDEQVYCAKCYSYNKKPDKDEMTCAHCDTVLDISTHYSKKLGAYLGYIKDRVI